MEQWEQVMPMFSDEFIWAVGVSAVMMGFDLLTGFMGACMNHEVNSEKMRSGLYHKATLMCVIILAAILEIATAHIPELGFQVPLTVPVCVIITLTEVVSILENLCKINPDLKGSSIMKLFKVNNEDVNKDA